MNMAGKLYTAEKMAEEGVAGLEESIEDDEIFGRNWPKRFRARYSDRINTGWAAKLDSQRAQCANPIEIKRHFMTCSSQYEKYNSRDCDRWSADEAGFMDATDIADLVWCRVGTKLQHMIQGGSRELTTVLPLICADGSCLPPLVIFKGEHLQKSWVEKNPGGFLYVFCH